MVANEACWAGDELFFGHDMILLKEGRHVTEESAWIRAGDGMMYSTYLQSHVGEETS